ncbi:Uncharacterized protein dnm_080210 [Desulfonema magnum]|uniref:Uncharacterized protein n=1 Tax=Desulfonema magnum TaxID=45655 RepID=A0A975GTB0_9BACT|nr:Uncharacterized protein dnm_080210 [Desulfonema magnum]
MSKGTAFPRQAQDTGFLGHGVPSDRVFRSLSLSKGTAT